MVRGYLCGGRIGRVGLHVRCQLLRQPHPAGLGTACRCIWAGLDPALRNDGGCRLAGLAGARLARCASGADTLSSAARGQRLVELAVLRLEAGRACLC
ncbi:hypothetical protein G6F68_021293 [Rhizopus microsporus]|nr:hypothetical protein G6F68_021293 [Rhizopus microsporus]